MKFDLEIKTSGLRSIKSVEDEIAKARELQITAFELEKKLKSRLADLKGTKYVDFLKGKKFKYSEVILVEIYNTIKGLGYEDDYDQFYGFELYHPNCEWNIRPLTKEGCQKYGIPLIPREKERYESVYPRHQNYGDDYYAFMNIFKDVVRVNKDDPYRTEFEKSFGKKRFINV